MTHLLVREVWDNLTDPPQTFRVLDRDDLDNLPTPEPLIEDTLDLGTVAVLGGPWGSGKSFLSLDWGACVATGKPWQGRTIHRADPDYAGASVLFIAAEGAYGLAQRLNAWECAWGQAGATRLFRSIPSAVNLTEPMTLAELIYGEIEYEHTTNRPGHGYALIVVDTLAKCMVGAEENSAKDMGGIVDALYKIRDAGKCEAYPAGPTVLAVHHTGRDGRTMRGSSALEAGVDTVYQVSKEGNEIHLARTKAKDRPLHDEMTLTLNPIPGTESAVISVHHGVDKPERADKLLSTFRALFGQTGASRAELRTAAEMPSATFHRALNDLLESGELINHGSDKRPFYKERTR